MLAIGCLVLSSCDSFPGDARKSYPDALDLPEVTVREAARPGVVPAEMNVTAYVIDVFSCEPGYKCVVEDHIWIAASPFGRPADSIYAGVHAARQFREGRAYLFSLRAMRQPRSDSVEALRFSILGYDAL